MGKDTQRGHQIDKVSKRVRCLECNSYQLTSNKRGYSFSFMFKVLFIMLGLSMILNSFKALISMVIYIYTIYYIISILATLSFFLSFPTALISGFIGRNKVLYGCMKCESKWLASEK